MKGNKIPLRLIASGAAAVLLTAAIIIDGADGIGTPITSILGGYAAVAACTLLLWRMPAVFHVCAQLFIVLAMGFGSILNLYDIWPGYDRVVHFISGVIIFFLGEYLGAKYFYRGQEIRKGFCMAIGLLAAFAAAGLWEVYEFSMDCLINTQMQGNNIDTMGDIVSGVLGGVGGCIAAFIINWVKKGKNT